MLGVSEAGYTKETNASDLTNKNLSELLAALNEAEIIQRVRTSLQWVLQELIEAEASSMIGAGPMSAPTPGPTSETVIGPGRCPRELATSSWQSPSFGRVAPAPRFWSGAGGSIRLPRVD